LQLNGKALDDAGPPGADCGVLAAKQDQLSAGDAMLLSTIAATMVAGSSVAVGAMPAAAPDTVGSDCGPASPLGWLIS
jgi:hypothetical protein